MTYARLRSTLLLLLPTLAIVSVAVLTRPAVAPGAAGLDASIDLYFPWRQSLDGLSLRGVFSWTLLSFHPGPAVNWTMVTGGASLGSLLGPAWFPFGAWLGLLVMSSLAMTSAARFVHIRFGFYPAALSLVSVFTWYLLQGPGEWWKHLAFAQPVWNASFLAPAVCAAVAAVVAMCDSKERAVPVRAKRAAAVGVGLWSGIAAQVHLSIVPFAVSLVLVGGAMAWRKSLRRPFLIGAGLGWSFLPLRIATDGLLFWRPAPGVSSDQPGPLPVIHQSWLESVDRISRAHTLLPAVVLAFISVVFVVAVVIDGRRSWSSRHVIALVVVALGWLQLLAFHPGPYNAYHTAWMEPVWLTAIAIALYQLVARVARPLPRQRELPIRALTCVAVLACVTLGLSVHHTLDGSRSLNDPQEPFPTRAFTEVLETMERSPGPLKLALGPNPERHATALEWFAMRGVEVCSLDVASPDNTALGSSPLDGARCSADQRATPGFVLSTDSTDERVVADTLLSWDFTFQHTAGWAMSREGSTPPDEGRT